MEQLPLYISIVSGVTTLLAVAFFYKATNGSKTTLLLLTGWVIVQAFISFSGFYTKTDSMPPRLTALVLPPLAIIAALFALPAGRRYLDGLDLKWLTLLHTVRIPVEVVLFWLFLYKTVPQLMTFEGRNFDILSGLTAPLIFYFGVVKKRLGRKAMLLWNIACLALLVNIVGIAILSAPTPFQKLAFDQPNIAVLYFPFAGLPGVVVPLVLLSHMAAIRQLLTRKNFTPNVSHPAEELGSVSVSPH